MWELLNFWTLQGHMDKSLTMRKAQVVWDILVMSETKKNWDWDNWDSLRLRLRQRHWDSSRLRLRHPGWRPKKQDNDKIETLRFNVAKTVQSRQMGQKTFVKTWRDRQHRLRQHLLRHSRLRLRHIETIETETNWLRQIIIAKMSHRNSAFLTWRLSSACPNAHRPKNTDHDCHHKPPTPTYTATSCFCGWAFLIANARLLLSFPHGFGLHTSSFPFNPKSCDDKGMATMMRLHTFFDCWPDGDWLVLSEQNEKVFFHKRTSPTEQLCHIKNPCQKSRTQFMYCTHTKTKAQNQFNCLCQVTTWTTFSSHIRTRLL